MIVEMYFVILIVIAHIFLTSLICLLPAITNNEVAKAADISDTNVVVRFSER